MQAVIFHALLAERAEDTLYAPQKTASRKAGAKQEPKATGGLWALPGLKVQMGL